MYAKKNNVHQGTVLEADGASPALQKEHVSWSNRTITDIFLCSVVMVGITLLASLSADNISGSKSSPERLNLIIDSFKQVVINSLTMTLDRAFLPFEAQRQQR